MKIVNPLLVAVVILSSYGLSLGQEEEEEKAHAFHVQTFYIGDVEGGSMTEFDSLTSLLTEHVTSKSKFLLNQQMMTHLWGSDSREFIIIREYGSLSDLMANSEEDTGDLFESYWDTDEKRKAFNEAYNKYFRGFHHSDEIYQEIKGGRK